MICLSHTPFVPDCNKNPVMLIRGKFKVSQSCKPDSHISLPLLKPRFESKVFSLERLLILIFKFSFGSPLFKGRVIVVIWLGGGVAQCHFVKMSLTLTNAVQRPLVPHKHSDNGTIQFKKRTFLAQRLTKLYSDYLI